MKVIKTPLVWSEQDAGFGSKANLDNIWTAITSTFDIIDNSDNISLSIAYMDGSFAARDALIADFATNASVNTAIDDFAPNSSVNTAIANFSSNASVNSALLSNASLGLAFDQYTNVSLGLVNSNYSTNASVNSALLSNASLGLAFDRFTNVSLGLANNSYATNASVNTAFLKNASLGNNVRYRADLGVGLRDASGNVYDATVIDSSGYLKIGPTNWVQWPVVSITLG